MLPDQETELKLRLLDPSDYSRITSDMSPGGAIPKNRKESAYDNVYYDTADRRLLSGGLALRVRTEGSRAVATVKDAGTMSGGLYVRGEWNAAIGANENPAHAFARLPIGDRLSEAIAGAPLVPLMKTTYKRVSVELSTRDSVIEFSADNGRISAGRKSMPLCEAELELKSGSVADLLKLGARLAESYPLLIEKQSKFERGLSLTGLSQVSEPPLPDAPDTTVQEVISACLIRDIAAVLDLQSKFLEKSGRALSAHQFRVGLRRLRALLSFTKPVLKTKVYMKHSGKLRALASELTLIRELDVLLEAWHAVKREHPELAGQNDGLEKILRAERRRERAHLADYIKRAPATVILLDFWAAVSDGIWTGKADAPIEEFCRKRLKKWTARFRSCLKKADFKDPSEAHSLRILGKNLRYVEDALFSDVVCDAAIPVEVLKRYQNRLGIMCDARQNLLLLKKLREAYDTPAVQRDIQLMMKSEKRILKDSAARIKKEVSKY